MKKIMFNDKYGLTQAVLEGRKTQTRRIVTDRLFQECRSNGFLAAGGFNDEWKTKSLELLVKNNPYKIGEEVAIAQCYSDMANEGADILADMLLDETTFKPEYYGAGWSNKMFVKAEYMPHHIKITNIRIERLKDVSNEDCLKEGVYESLEAPYNEKKYGCVGLNMNEKSPRNVFAALIDKVSGKGTWQSNPYVFVYDFELIR